MGTRQTDDHFNQERRFRDFTALKASEIDDDVAMDLAATVYLWAWARGREDHGKMTAKDIARHMKDTAQDFADAKEQAEGASDA